MTTIESARFQLFLAAVFLAVFAGGLTDLALDRPSSWVSAHVLFEVAVMALSLGLAVTLWRGWSQTSRSLSELRHAMEARQAERDRWRESAQKLLEGLGAAIDRQFKEWGLTPAEREVALLLLKGYSHKHIAAATHRSERTVRQHAVTIYRKAGLSNRAELAAFFLEDLMLPDSPA
ncbi:MAG: LuxR C-terminal-related transcriptional regulator [Gemmatimonadales bacterium]|jgi:DNA-binding NarL/FixJ family response regulator